MSGRFFKVICAVVLSVGLVGQANAGLIVGEIYKDAIGSDWQFVGEFDLADGPRYNNADGNGLKAPTQNGLQAAFGIQALGLNALDVIALSAFESTFAFDAIMAGDNVVNNMAWYDMAGGVIARRAEDLVADFNNNNIYDVAGDMSAYINDKSPGDRNINYVFKSVEVPEPSIFNIFTLAILGLGYRKLKR
jgi:hypothetical protein